MAEIFGAVASGAGLISLAVQLLESSQKLKAFYDATKDAPQAVADLGFELETMSLSLRQLEFHRRSDVLGDELLSRCYLTCSKMVGKIEIAVNKMERQLQRSRSMGRLYAAFKEPDTRKLLEELEQAKSSMLFAYMSYCQSWNIREASNRAATTHAQVQLLSSHEKRLQDLDRTIQAGHAAILSQISSSEPRVAESSRPPPLSFRDPHRQTHATQRSSRKVRLKLPRWFTQTVWEFGTYDIGDGWMFQIRPINIRPRGTRAFAAVRSGDVETVKRLFASGELSASDCEYSRFSEHRSLLTIAAAAGRFELCNYLLQEFPRYRDDADLLRGLSGFLYFCSPSASRATYDHAADAMFKLFIGQYGLQLDLHDLAKSRNPRGRSNANVYGSALTKPLLREVMASQAVPFETWSFAQRFSVAVRSRFWTPEIFVEMARPDTLADLAVYKDPDGKTALHWAAEHFALNVGLERYAMRHRGLGTYAEQSVKLISMGADLHALDRTRGTPFSCVLQASAEIPEHRTTSRLAEIVRHWGYIVGSASSLDLYAERENSLTARLGDQLNKVCVDGISNIGMHRLSVLDGSDLIIEVDGSLQIQMWDFRPPPGAWDRTVSKIDRIPWRPSVYFEGNNYYLWQAADRILTRPMSIPMREVEPIPGSLAGNISDSLREWIEGVQDDHGFAAMKSRRSIVPGGGYKNRRRAASLPPLPTPVDGRSIRSNENTGFRFPRKWLSKAHKCPLDLRWKYASYCSDATREKDSVRRCMQGRCDDWVPDLLYKNRWEVELLKDASKVDVARKFADRFRPVWRSIVDATHTRAQRRLDLSMSQR